MKTNFFLIDYENVQPESLEILDQNYFRVIVFVGHNQVKIPFETAMALQNMGERARYIKITGNGSDALDFHIAFYIGWFAAQEAELSFHIISKDTGFDPLIEHLKTKKISVKRWASIMEIPAVRCYNATSTQEKIDVILSHFQRPKVTKPKSVQTLSSSINALFQKRLSEEDILLLVTELQKKGVIVLDDTKVSFISQSSTNIP